MNSISLHSRRAATATLALCALMAAPAAMAEVFVFGAASVPRLQDVNEEATILAPATSAQVSRSVSSPAFSGETPIYSFSDTGALTYKAIASNDGQFAGYVSGGRGSFNGKSVVFYEVAFTNTSAQAQVGTFNFFIEAGQVQASVVDLGGSPINGPVTGNAVASANFSIGVYDGLPAGLHVPATPISQVFYSSATVSDTASTNPVISTDGADIYGARGSDRVAIKAGMQTVELGTFAAGATKTVRYTLELLASSVLEGGYPPGLPIQFSPNSAQAKTGDPFSLNWQNAATPAPSIVFTSPVPEPATWLTFALGLAALTFTRARHSRQARQTTA